MICAVVSSTTPLGGDASPSNRGCSAWQGVQRATKDLPIVLRDIEPGTPNAIEPAMRAFAERNFDLIIGVGFAQAPIMEDVAKDYPHIQFAIIDGVSKLVTGWIEIPTVLWCTSLPDTVPALLQIPVPLPYARFPVTGRALE